MNNARLVKRLNAQADLAKRATSPGQVSGFPVQLSLQGAGGQRHQEVRRVMAEIGTDHGKQVGMIEAGQNSGLADQPFLTERAAIAILEGMVNTVGEVLHLDHTPHAPPANEPDNQVTIIKNRSRAEPSGASPRMRFSRPGRPCKILRLRGTGAQERPPVGTLTSQSRGRPEVFIV